MERRLALWLRRFSACFARFLAEGVLAIDTKDAEKAQAAYVLAVPVIDRMADKGIIHKNKAARHKSRLNGHIKALNVAAAA